MMTAGILKKARALVEKGWAQGDDVDQIDSHCIATALWAATQDIHEYFLAKYIMCEANGFSGTLLTTWNDAPGRTQAEVLAAIDKGIGLAGVRHG